MKFDQVLYNGTIITMDETLSKKTWIAVKDGKIAALGEGEAYEKDADELIDLEGATVLPGLFDCHNHVPLAGLCLNSVDLSDAGSIEEVLKRMEKACTEADEGEYVYGMNYVPQAIKETRYPTAKELDEICHGHLITIFAATLHGCCCNSAGMKIAQVSENLPGVEKINGEPTGVYTSDESSFFATSKILGSLSDDQLWQFIADCVEYGASQGLSNIHGLFGQFVEGDRDMKLFMERGESLPMGMTAFYQTWDVNKAKEMGLPRVGGCLTLDGAAFEYTMANFEPYVTAPALRGVLYHNDEEIYQVVKTAHENNMQCAMHAVGERAIDQLIYTYHRVITEQGAKDLRHRIEHFCLPTESQIKMAKEMNLILSMQPGFSYLWDEDFAGVLGRERGDRIDPFKAVVEAGNIVCAGSDCPVTGMTPLTDIAHCVRGRNPVRNISMTEALKLFTVNAAYAAGLEKEKGSIEVGKDADLTVIDRNPYEYEDNDAIFEMKPLMTFNRGRMIYSVK